MISDNELFVAYGLVENICKRGLCALRAIYVGARVSIICRCLIKFGC